MTHYFEYYQILTATHLPTSEGWQAELKADIALPGGNPTSELWDVTCHMGSNSVTFQPTQVNATSLTPAMQADTQFTYPGGMKGRVDLVDLIAPWPGVELATSRSRVRRRTTAPPRQCKLGAQKKKKMDFSLVTFIGEVYKEPVKCEADDCHKR